MLYISQTAEYIFKIPYPTLPYGSCGQCWRASSQHGDESFILHGGKHLYDDNHFGVEVDRKESGQHVAIIPLQQRTVMAMQYANEMNI